MPGRENSRTCGVIITDMLKRLGKDSTNSDLRDLGQDVLNQSVDEFNLEREWSDRLLETSTATTSVGTTYALPLRFKRFIGRVWALNSDNERVREIEDKPWAEFMRSVSQENVGASEIRLVSVQNRVTNTNFEVWPQPSAAWVALHPRLELQYYADITHCTSDATTLDLNTALERAIELNALLILNDYIGDSNKANAYFRQAARASSFAIGADNRVRGNWSNLRGFR